MKFTLLGVVGLVGVALVWFAVANAAAQSTLDAKLDELRQAGEPVTLSDLAHKPIPPETNAATYLRRAAGELEAVEKRVGAAEDAATPQEQEEFVFRYHATPAILAAIQSAFAESPHAVPLLEQAAECPDYDPQLDFAQSPRQFLEQYLDLSQDVRRPVRVLNYRVVMLLMNGRRDEALETCLTMFQLARHFDHRPLMINLLVTLAVRGVAVAATDAVLRSGPLPPAAYDALEAELARHNLSRRHQEALRSERAFGIDMFADQMYGGYLRQPHGKRDQSSYLDLLHVAIRNAARPYYDAQARAETQAVLDRAGGLTKTLAPALEAESLALARTGAQLRCLRVLNAVLARRHAGQTDEPALADLGLPAETTTDPFNGKPLALKKMSDGWLIYSVGQDLKDDGGRIHWDGATDVGLGPATTESKSDRRE